MARRPAKQDYVVIGLGRFGASLALKLMELGHSVLAIDRDRDLVQQMSDEITQTVALDATDEDALRAIGIEEFDTAIVAIGNDFESNLLITVLLKEIGLPYVICKALNERQKSILLRIGANQVVLPEHEAGIRLARQLSMPLVTGRFELEPGISISEFRCPEALAGRSLGELDLPGRFGISVLVIKGARLRSSPSEDEVLNAGDILLVMGPDAGIARLHAWVP
jgi:trk system potassium uptake protein TrkA